MIHRVTKKSQISTEEYDFFRYLSGLYEALRVSATDPVVMRTNSSKEPSGLELASKTMIIPPPSKKAVFSHIFYDCFEDEEFAIRTMIQRISNSADDIRKNIEFHESAAGKFSLIEEALESNSRTGVYGHINALCKLTLNYADAVRTHVATNFPNDFLGYPTCIPGHYFYIKNTPLIGQKEFNQLQSIDSLSESIEHIRTLADYFVKLQTPIPDVDIYDEKNIPGGSLNQQIQISRQLLQNVGFSF